MGLDDADGVHASGADGRRFYLDAIDEAFQTRARRNGERPPRMPHRRLRDLAIRQLQHAEKIQRMMGAQITEVRKRKEPIDTQFVHAFNMLTRTITNAMEQIRRDVESEKKTMGGLSNDQLDEVLRLHLPRIAAGMEERDRRAILQVWFGEDVTRVLLAPREAEPVKAAEAAP